MLQSLRATGAAAGVPATPGELAELAAAIGQPPLPASLVARDGTLWFLAGDGAERRLIALVPDSPLSPPAPTSPTSPAPSAPRRPLPGSPRRLVLGGRACTAFVSPLTPAAAAALRAAVPELAPRPWGLRTTAGFGDRLGLATPGHIAALRQADPQHLIGPIFAQQSIRENARTGRTPQSVLDDATWGALAAGWTHGVGADADHLKLPADIDSCVAAGYSFFTVDPGDHVHDQAAKLSRVELRKAYASLPWTDLRSSPAALLRAWSNRRIDLGARALHLDETQVLVAAVKYGRAVAHAASLYARLAAQRAEGDFELEVSVDETDAVTTLEEHAFIACELQRLGVRFVSLAPRYVGRWEKGVDFIGDLDAFRASFAEHARLSEALGPYKLSLHSGSDKFSVYPIAAELARGRIHLKTAGTSYLEGMRVVAATAPELFRRIWHLAAGVYERDRATYHVSGRLDQAPDPTALRDDELPALLDDHHVRQVLHVTFGSVIASPELAGELHAALVAAAGAYAAALERHFARHLAPFARHASGPC